MTDAHAQVALEKDERKEKRVAHERLVNRAKAEAVAKVDRASQEVQAEQLASERSFRTYLKANRQKVIDGEKMRGRSPFLRARK